MSKKELDRLNKQREKIVKRLMQIDDKIYHLTKPGFKIPIKGFR